MLCLGYLSDPNHSLWLTPVILLMIANCLIRTSKGSNMPIIDLFPKQYMKILDTLISSSCAYVCPCVSNISSTLTSPSLSDRLCTACLIPHLLWGFPYKHDHQGGACASATFKMFSWEFQCQGCRIRSMAFDQGRCRWMESMPVSTGRIFISLAH